MNKKKLKKLINNPKQFIYDSTAFKKVTARKINSHIKIGFIVIGEDEKLIESTTQSIIAASNKAKSNNIEIKYFSSSVQKNATTDNFNINHTVESMSSDFIKILNEGDVISTDFIKNLFLNDIDSNKVDLIITPYTNDIQTNNIDPLFAATQPKITSGEIESSRITVLPLYSCLIFNRELFDTNNELPQGKILSSEVTSCINLLNKVELHNNHFQYINNSFTSHSVGGRLHELFMATSMNATITLDCLRKKTELHQEKGLTALSQRCAFYFTHCLVLSYLKNKKADELLSCPDKEEIYAAIIILINSLGVNLIKNFSSNNYNHVHKLG